MRDTVNHHAARSTYTLATVVVEGNRLLTFRNQPLVEDIQHLKEGHVDADVGNLVGDKAAFVLCILLTPHLQSKFHRLLPMLEDG